jgi:hypothetical protein
MQLNIFGERVKEGKIKKRRRKKCIPQNSQNS